MNSGLQGLLVWAIAQLSIGALGWTWQTIRLGSGDLWTREELDALLWQGIFGGLFSWGAVLMALALVVAAIGEYIAKAQKDMKSQTDMLAKRIDSLGKAEWRYRRLEIPRRFWDFTTICS